MLDAEMLLYCLDSSRALAVAGERARHSPHHRLGDEASLALPV
jgi:hypothetical protein